jgi:hypothetical protein
MSAIQIQHDYTTPTSSQANQNHYYRCKAPGFKKRLKITTAIGKQGQSSSSSSSYVGTLSRERAVSKQKKGQGPRACKKAERRADPTRADLKLRKK